MVSLLPRFAEFAAALPQLANEHDVQDSRYVNHTDMRALRDAVKAIDPDRLVTASSRELSAEEKLDFYSQHLERGPDCAAKTESLAKQIIAAMPTRAPLHFQEPFRRDYSPAWNPQAADFYQDLAGAKGGGAAGWCFHNISNKSRGDFAPMWELAGGIYGKAVPYTQQLLHRTTPAPYRPEGERNGPVIHGGAHVGDGSPRFGTLMHYGMHPLV